MSTASLHDTAPLAYCDTCGCDHADYRHDAFPDNLTRMARAAGSEAVYSACEGCGALLCQCATPARLCDACADVEVIYNGQYHILYGDKDPDRVSQRLRRVVAAIAEPERWSDASFDTLVSVLTAYDGWRARREMACDATQSLSRA